MHAATDLGTCKMYFGDMCLFGLSRITGLLSLVTVWELGLLPLWHCLWRTLTTVCTAMPSVLLVDYWGTAKMHGCFICILYIILMSSWMFVAHLCLFPFCSQNAVMYTRPFVTTVIFGDDLVPRYEYNMQIGAIHQWAFVLVWYERQMSIVTQVPEILPQSRAFISGRSKGTWHGDLYTQIRRRGALMMSTPSHTEIFKITCSSHDMLIG